MPYNISIIGAGKVGSALALRLYERGHTLQQIFSRSLDKAEALAKQVQAAACNDLSQLNQSSDVSILAVKDDAIEQVASQLPPSYRILAHTSGATPMQALQQASQHGVFYPLQTFSSQFPPDFEELPFCIHGNSEAVEQELFELAETICPNVYRIGEAQRQSLHVTAVIVNNFTNHLFAVAEKICKHQQVPFDLLRPLIRQTVRKIEQASPAEVQTGPAARGDHGTIERHLAWLQVQAPTHKGLYEQLSQHILERKD